MTPDDLRSLFRRIGVVARNGEWVCPCPRFNDAHPSTSSDPYKVVVSPGSRRVCLVFCRVCGSDGIGTMLTAWALRAEDFGVSSSAVESQAVWDAAGYPASPADEGDDGRDFDLYDRVYRRLLALSPLTAEHQRWLAKRGLVAAAAGRFGYGSADAEAVYGDPVLAGEDVEAVPGFSRDPHGRVVAHVREDAILTPCRDRVGRVVAIKMRLLEGRSRIRSLSSRHLGGPSAYSGVHFPTEARLLSGLGRVWVTEGERKGDVVHAVTGDYVLAVPGTSRVGEAVAELGERWDADTEVVVAFDRDSAGDGAARALVCGVAPRGFRRITRASWSAKYKGVDDAFAAGAEVRYDAIPSDELARLAGGSPSHRTRGDVHARVLAALAKGPRWRDDLDHECGRTPAVVTRLAREGKIETRLYRGRGQGVALAGTPASAWDEFSKTGAVKCGH